MQEVPDRESLQRLWKELYSKTLPSLARIRDPAQPKWPVTLDHCFARIILDHTVGEGKKQWDECLKRPAIKQMSLQQLGKSIELARRIVEGKEDLVALDLQSLEVRGKMSKKNGRGKPAKPAQDQGNSTISKSSEKVVHERVSKKRKNTQSDSIDATAYSSKKTKTLNQQSLLSFVATSDSIDGHVSPSGLADEDTNMDLSPLLQRIESHSTLTPYRKRLYTTLLCVPKGRYTTYAALSDFLHSSARAVGNGMKNNPLAPEVPCHRVLASDGSIGGFGGSWGIEGKNAGKKFDLLKEEGVRFDSKGKVRGQPFRHFIDLLKGP